MNSTRRSFIKTTSMGSIAMVANPLLNLPAGKDLQVEVLNPCDRVPISFIIDDSTCLINLAPYAIVQLGEVWPERYKKRYGQIWRKLPHEIPDSFVREFAEWSLENGVKGKYSVVPYPACTGWVHRFIPGYTEQELKNSLDLIREVILPNWDIHPEMVSHTRVIDIKTGQPYPYATPEYTENSEWSQTKSVAELAAYQAYALNILKEAGLPCEGLTSPGVYGRRNLDNLALSTLEAVRDVYAAEIPHFFTNLYTEKGPSVAPRVLFPSNLNGNDPRCVVEIVGCTYDWFGGWDGLTPGNVDRFITSDLQSGRMVDVIDSGEPAIMVCHWAGIYYNGEKTGFNIFKEINRRLCQKYGNRIMWMKLSEIARYWAAKELTTITLENNNLSLMAPFSSPQFTLKLNTQLTNPKIMIAGEYIKPLERIWDSKDIESDTWYSDKTGSVICFDLKKGLNEIENVVMN